MIPIGYLGEPPGAHASSTVSSAVYGVSRSAPGSGRTVALTFDDGPGRDTARIMAVLAASHVTATFFNLGLSEAGGAATVRAQQVAGYALGGHTWDHTSLRYRSAASQAGEMDRERALQRSITGVYPRLFRPPYGNFDTTTLVLAQQRGMRVWNWSVDTEDWKASGSGDGYWVDRIRYRAEEGAGQDHPVILMHNQTGGNPATVAALPSIISYYKARGFTFVDLFGNAGPPIVRALAPRSGNLAGGTRVVVTGTGLRGVRAVYFGTRAGTGLRISSATKLYITSPKHAAGWVDIRVVTDHGTSGCRTADRFLYVSAPSIASMSPASGPSSGGFQVRVTGRNFHSVTSVDFGSVHGTALRGVTPTQLYVTAPAHAAGTVVVRVVTKYGVSTAATVARFTYIAPLAVTGVSPRPSPAPASSTSPR